MLDISTLLNAFPGYIAQGAIWGIMALGLYISYRLLEFSDLTVDGSFATGAAVTVMPMAGAAGPLEGYEEVYHDYIVDRAFGFVITDSYGAVLFSGVVNSVN